MDSVNVIVTGGICKDERYGFSQCYLIVTGVICKDERYGSVNVIVTGGYVKMNAMDTVNVIVTGVICKDERYGCSQCNRDRRYM